MYHNVESRIPSPDHMFLAHDFNRNIKIQTSRHRE